MNVLITNIVMDSRTGTEVVTEQLADGLARRGINVAIYTSLIGDLGYRMRQKGHIIIDRIRATPFVPDVIHGHHNQVTMAAVTAFPDVPALFVTHDATASWDRTPFHPQIIRYYAVDELCRSRLVSEGVDRDSTFLLQNTVDLEMYPQRAPLPPQPKRGLILTKMKGGETAVRNACRKADVELDAIGPGVGKVVDNLGEVFQNYDLVFATARMALEAVVAGCAVIVCDMSGMAGFLTPETWRKWRPWNLGRGILNHPPNEENLGKAIQAYDPNLASRVADLARREAALEDQIDRLTAIYEELVDHPDFEKWPPMDQAAYLETATPTFRKNQYWNECTTDIFTLPAEGVGRHIARLNELIQSYENSKSWKITRPLREIMAWLRRRKGLA
jgi:hypothetical protein